MLTALLCCGTASNGELGLRGVEEDHVTTLTPVMHFVHSKKIIDVASGLNHTIVLLQDGTVFTCGNNDTGQLGRGNSQRRLEQVESLTPHAIRKVCCGAGFSVALNEAGQLFAWGSNSHGQLGIPCDEEVLPKPKIIKSLAVKQVIQVACGNHHALALTKDGEVYSWGRNHHCQLGNGTDKSESKPQLIKSLRGLPIAQIAAGGNHSFALTFSGALFAWGKNEFGQLGSSDTSDKMLPSLQTTLRSQNVKYVCCGENHSVVLTQDGGVFTFGAGMYGQLGHGSKSNELLPRKVSELMGNVATQIACGRCHTMVYVPSKRRIYAFGLGGSGQLGLSMASQINLSPIVVSGPWTNNLVSPLSNSTKGGCNGQTGKKSPDISSNCDMDVSSPPTENNISKDEAVTINQSDSPMEIDGEDYLDSLKAAERSERTEEIAEIGLNSSVYKIVCGGDHTFVIAYHLDKGFNSCDKSLDFRVSSPDSLILTIENDIVQVVVDISPSECVPQDLMSYIETAFSSAACLNGSFLKLDGSHYNCSTWNHGIDLNAACNLFHYIEAAQNSSITELVATCLESNLLPNLSSRIDIEAVRLFVYLPFCHLFKCPASYLDGIIYPFAKALLEMGKELIDCVAHWWTTFDGDQFKRLTMVFKNSILFIIKNLAEKTPEGFAIRRQLHDCLNVLRILKDINVFNKLLPYQDFYMPDLTDLVDVREDYVRWVHTTVPFIDQIRTSKLFLCDYPFIFDARAKSLILHTDSLLQMRTAMDSAYRQNLTSVLVPLVPLAQPYLVLYVSRENIVLDTIAQLAQQEYQDLKKPLQVIFYGEDAVDAGGVKKEFFLLLTKEMLDPKYGMFKEYTETHCIWFHAQTFEDAGMFGLIGIVCGLAIYNNIIIDLPFPLVLYKKLLKEEVKLEDIKGLSPTVVKSLSELLQYDGDDVEDVFVLYFEVTLEIYGEPISYELKPGGKEIPVTKENKAEYVNLYVDFLLNTSVQAPFEAFSKGFHKVCSTRILELFHAEELMALVIGNESYEWDKLEMHAEYKNGYHKDHPAIKMFWKVFHSLDESDKRKFLLFLTGSDRIPILGMESIKIIIQPMNVSDEYLPVAHTCFNVLDLPHYSSEEVLRHKLRNAIQQTHGFGLA